MLLRASGFAMLVALSIGAVAYADAIQKWRTPDGELYFGDRPPAGSTLLETVPDTPTAASSKPTEASELERAAAEGRDIIRRREQDRAEEGKRQAERELWQDQLEASVEPDYFDSPLWIIETRPPCAPGEGCFDGSRHRRHHHHHGDRDRPPTRGPWPRTQAQSSRMNPPPPPLIQDRPIGESIFSSPSDR